MNLGSSALIDGVGRDGRPPPPTIDVAAGDWQCPACNNWNWARRNECNKCCQAHPSRAKQPPSKMEQTLNARAGLDPVKGYGTASVGAKRTGGGGGFREIDEEEEARRKMRASEASAAKEQRKAEKKKCEYCKRFSCIC